MTEPASAKSALPPDDLARELTVISKDDPHAVHLGLAGDTYTTLLTGKDTAGRLTLIDMHIPPGGGPPPHRHDFEETFIVLAGQIEATFRGKKSTVHTGQTVHIPANSPHQFVNAGKQDAHLLCICSPAGQEDYFAQVGVPVATSTTPPPKPDPATEAASREKALSLAAQYKTEFLPHA